MDPLVSEYSFYINLPIGGVALGIITLFFRPPAHANPVQAPWKERLLHLDLPGATLLIGGLVCFLLDMQWGGTTKAWNTPHVVGTLVGWCLLTIAFVVVQWLQGEKASLVPRLIKGRIVAGVSMFVFLSVIPTCAVSLEVHPGTNSIVNQSIRGEFPFHLLHPRILPSHYGDECSQKRHCQPTLHRSIL